MIRKIIEGLRNRIYVKKSMREIRLEDDKNKVEDQIETADRMLNLKEYDAAIKLYKHLMSNKKLLNSKQYRDLVLGYSEALSGKGENKKALAQLDKILRKYSRDEEILATKALIMLLSCNLHKKISELKLDLIIAKKEVNKYDYRDMDKWNQARSVMDIVEKDYEHSKKFLPEVTEILKTLLKKKSDQKKDYLYYLGISAYLQGLVHESLGCFDMLLDMDEDYKNNIISFQFFDNIKKDRAIVQSAGPDKYSHQKKYKTERGVMVRSKIEAMIDNFYFNNGIKARYEPTLVLDTHILHPDWEIDIDGKKIYHEHIGSPESQQQMEWKVKLFEKHNIPCFITNWDEEDDIINILTIKIQRIKEK